MQKQSHQEQHRRVMEQHTRLSKERCINVPPESAHIRAAHPNVSIALCHSRKYAETRFQIIGKLKRALCFKQMHGICNLIKSAEDMFVERSGQFL